MLYTDALAKYLEEIEYEKLPEKTVDYAKKLILHVLAASLSAAEMKQAQSAVKIAVHKKCDGAATVWGSNGIKTSAEEAAFVNATIADILDWEDCSWTGHPSAGAVSVALAVGEERHKSGKEIITAIVAAYDIYQRIAMSVQPKTAENWGKEPWGLTCWQIFAGAAAAAKLYDFSAEDIASCLGVTTHFTALPGAVREDSDIYHYAHGICARNGIAAAEIVRAGVDPIRRTFDGAGSFGYQICKSVDFDWYNRELGSWFAIEETLFKHWPANMWIQAPLDALAALVNEYGFGFDDIESVAVSPEIELYAKKLTDPVTIMKAEFSLAYCFAAYLRRPVPSAEWYADEQLYSDDVRVMEKKIRWMKPEKNPLEQFMIFWQGSFPDTQIVITLKDGRVLEKTTCYPKGHPKNMFSWKEEAAHFNNCAGCLSEEKRKHIIEMIQNLEKLEDVCELCSLLVR